MKAAIIGAGNIGMALAEGLIQSHLCIASEITLTRRTDIGLTDLKKAGFNVSTQNAEAVSQADLVFLCVLPQQLNTVLTDMATVADLKNKLFISVVTGAHTDAIKAILGDKIRLIRAMPNTAMRVAESMTCLSASNATQKDIKLAQKIFATLGHSIIINEDMMSAATALCACGTAFFLRTIRAAAQGGVEIGFHAHDAIQIAAQTALGAAKLLLVRGTHPEEEIDKVTSPKGCTIAGLNEMEHQGLSSAMIKGIKLSATIANELYKK